MKSEKMEWVIHTPNLLKEIAGNGEDGAAVKISLRILADFLHRIAERAIVLNDEKLTEIMFRMTLFEQADPLNDKFDKELFDKYIRKKS